MIYDTCVLLNTMCEDPAGCLPNKRLLLILVTLSCLLTLMLLQTQMTLSYGAEKEKYWIMKPMYSVKQSIQLPQDFKKKKKFNI